MTHVDTHSHTDIIIFGTRLDLVSNLIGCDIFITKTLINRTHPATTCTQFTDKGDATRDDVN